MSGEALCVFLDDAPICVTHNVWMSADSRAGWYCPVSGRKVHALDKPSLRGPLPPGIPANLTGCNVGHPAVAKLLEAHDRNVAHSAVYGRDIAGWDDGNRARLHLDEGSLCDYAQSLLAAASLLASNRINPGDL